MGCYLATRQMIFALSYEEKAKLLGASVASPVIHRLIETRGAEVMAKRYAEILSWTGVIADLLE